MGLFYIFKWVWNRITDTTIQQAFTENLLTILWIKRDQNKRADFLAGSLHIFTKNILKLRSEVFIWVNECFYINLDQRFTQNACSNKMFSIKSSTYSNFQLLSFKILTYTRFNATPNLRKHSEVIHQSKNSNSDYDNL